MKFEFFFRLKHKWHFTLFTSSCLSLFELGILVYILERLAWSHINTYQSLVWTYDHLFKYIFIGFNRALSDFQEASPPSEKLFAQIEAQKVLFSLIIISALISFRHMVFAACNYEKGYYSFCLFILLLSYCFIAKCNNKRNNKVNFENFICKFWMAKNKKYI